MILVIYLLIYQKKKLKSAIELILEYVIWDYEKTPPSQETPTDDLYRYKGSALVRFTRIKNKDILLWTESSSFIHIYNLTDRIRQVITLPTIDYESSNPESDQYYSYYRTPHLAGGAFSDDGKELFIAVERIFNYNAPDEKEQQIPIGNLYRFKLKSSPLISLVDLCLEFIREHISLWGTKFDWEENLPEQLCERLFKPFGGRRSPLSEEEQIKMKELMTRGPVEAKEEEIEQEISAGTQEEVKVEETDQENSAETQEEVKVEETEQEKSLEIQEAKVEESEQENSEETQEEVKVEESEQEKSLETQDELNKNDEEKENPMSFTS